jgi:hypothetical protein
MKQLIKILFTIFFTSLTNSLFAQLEDSIKLISNARQKEIFSCLWGDKKRMELHSNGIIYQFKSGLKDGMYIAYYDKTLKKDTAMIVVIQNGKINGLLQRWSPDSHYLQEECEYKNNMMNGYRKLYFITPDGNKLVNIEKWEDNALQEMIQVTF